MTDKRSTHRLQDPTSTWGPKWAGWELGESTHAEAGQHNALTSRLCTGACYRRPVALLARALTWGCRWVQLESAGLELDSCRGRGRPLAAEDGARNHRDHQEHREHRSPRNSAGGDEQ
eukprot:scaffold42862_cov53-Phaeocystis_antarctica.AAC.1